MQSIRSKGFALPTVLIASVVLLSILTVSVTATAAVRTSLKTQYYTQLAQAAGEAGVAYAKACLAENENEPTWTDDKPLKPSTDCYGNEALSPTLRVLVVAGGGSAGDHYGNTTAASSGGGGAGGLVFQEVPAAVGSTSVTVGAGGTQASNNAGNNGGNSVFGSITAVGGGGGGNRDNNPKNGGSGGGKGYFGSAVGLGTVGQGNNGGTAPGTMTSGLGGGGAGEAGGDNPTADSTTGPTDGGDGLDYSWIFGTTVGDDGWLAGGGGGGTPPSYATLSAFGGRGGGADGAASGGNGPAGQSNTGGGGGGASSNGSRGGLGGSGVVLVAYPLTSDIVASGGSELISGAYKVHVFNSSGTFTVSSLSNAACPSDPRCYVMQNGNIRSSFSIGMPTVDSQGKAVTIPNSGYVEIMRTSNGTVWRTYTQPTVQAAVVPDLCSGKAASDLGWSNAYVVSSNVSTSNPDGALPIAVGSSNSVLTGPHFFRKDFTVTKSGSYTISSSAGATYDLFVDGVLVVTQETSATNLKNITLEAGCHTVVAKLVNSTLTGDGAELRVAIRPQGSSAPIVTTDSSWRTSAGGLKGFAESHYYQGSSWATVRDIGAYNASPYTNGPTNWVATAGDSGARWVSTNHSFSGSNYPFSSYAYFINNNQAVWNLSSEETYTFVMACDDQCSLYVDGTEVLRNTATWSVSSTANVTLTEGQHQIAIELYNAGTAANPAAFLFSAVRQSDGVVVDRSGSHWTAANTWFGSSQTLYSYDATYVPTPSTSDIANVTVLLVGGGGGGGKSVDSTRSGGGGGGGGVVEQTVGLSAGIYPVVVGSGGSGTTGSGTTADEVGNLSNGWRTTFYFLMALGGGGGGNGAAGIGALGSSGGGAGRNSSVIAPGITGQGYSGGRGAAGTTSSSGGGGGGGAGGAGADGTSSAGGNGGAGRASSISGSTIYYGGGGGGARVGGSAGSGGTGNAGAGAISAATGTAGTSGRGGGGGGGSSNGNGTTGNGGSGGSGVVIIRYPTGSINATGGSISTSGGDTIHTFTSSTGTFTIISVD